MRKMLAVFAVLASAVLLAGLVHASIPTDGSVLLACTGRGNGIATRKSMIQASAGDVTASPTPRPPGVTGRTDARGFLSTSCTSQHVTFPSPGTNKPVAVDDLLTVEAAQQLPVTITVAGRQTYTGKVTAILVPAAGSAGCASHSHAENIVGGIPASSQSAVIVLSGAPTHACSYKLVVSSDGIGVFDGYVSRATISA
ncbi:MAG: hypothetical protein ABR548_05695 [Actinomycetota bacterium]|nr:hypothetical protein [Actinomycetota bacterium]